MVVMFFAAPPEVCVGSKYNQPMLDTAGQKASIWIKPRDASNRWRECCDRERDKWMERVSFSFSTENNTKFFNDHWEESRNGETIKFKLSAGIPAGCLTAVPQLFLLTRCNGNSRRYIKNHAQTINSRPLAEAG